MALTQQQLDYIKEHLNDRPRKKYIQESGISLFLFLKAARELGAEMRNNKKPPGIEECVRTYYPTMTAKEIEKEFGYDDTTVIRWALRLGVKSSPEKLERIRADRVKRIESNGRWKNPQKAAQTFRRLHKMECIRVMSGWPQKTRLRLATTTERARNIKCYLCHKYGYERTEQPYVLRGTENTRRCNESYFEQKYKLIFKWN